MNSENARRMMQAAQAKADEIGKPVSLAIVNAAGALVALDRFKEPPGFTLQVAEGKAVASAVMGFDSAVVAGWAQNLPAIVNAMSLRYAGRFVALQGAVVVRDESGVVGAIGVSGATSEEDETIAKAGAAAYQT
ncbi:MAG TPA: heme-binding protein [Dehalococcoidia bacterium]